MADENTLYLERSQVRAILIGVLDENTEIAEHFLALIDELPIVTKADLRNQE